MRLLMISLLTLIAGSAYSQAKISFSNAQTIDPDRYAKIKGDAYFFKDFVSGEIIDMEGVTYEDVLINFNAYEEAFEVRNGDRFIKLDGIYYKQVVMEGPEGDKVTFVRGVHPDFRGKFIQLLHKSDKCTLVKKFKVNFQETTANTVGRTEVFQRFMPLKEYYLVTSTGASGIQQLKLNKKKLIQTLGHKKELESFIKKEKIDISTEDGLVSLVEYWGKLE